LFAQAVTYAWFALGVGFFASAPPYSYADPDTARIKLSLSHPGKRKVECRRRGAKELADLPANMRAVEDCPRERWPVTVEMELDGERTYGQTSSPAGLAKDGPSIFYRAFQVPSGSHRLTLRLREAGESGFDHETTRRVDLAPGHVLAIEFHAEKGGFSIK